MRRIYLLFFLLVGSSYVLGEEADIEKIMKDHQIIPDVIDKGPKDFLKITYNNKKEVNLGAELTPTQTKDEPVVEWNGEPNAYYTLIMTDPDAPSRREHQLREWQHWMVVNIPDKALNKGEVLTAYVGSGPPKDTGLHRYVFLLYKQSEKLNFIEPYLYNNSTNGRSGFSTLKFARKYKLGQPIAGNFYQSQYDNYVPQLYMQLGVNL
ncbi:protein D3-like [Glossina fuscipes fuscipes]